MEIDVSDRRRLVNLVFQTLHFLVAFGFLIFGLVEFVSNPPFFDGYGDAKGFRKQNELPEDSFQVRENIILTFYTFYITCLHICDHM